MTTGMDEFQRRMFEIQEIGEKRRQEQILKMLLKERSVVLDIWPDKREYIQGLERAIFLIGGEKALD